MHRFWHVTSLALALSCCWAGTAFAVDSDASGEVVPLATCLDHPLGQDGVRRQVVKADISGLISGIPPRVAGTFGPGESGEVCIGFQNATGRTLDLELSKADVGVDGDGVPLVDDDDATYGAASWIDLPTKRVADMKQGEIAWLIVRVRVPSDAAPGSWYSNVTATSPTAPDPNAGTQVVASPSVAIQVFFDVPGEGKRGGVIQNARSGNIVWWDGLDIGRIGFLEKLRGVSLSTIKFDWQNRGSYSDAVSARIVIESALTGRKVETLDVPSSIVLRGATRKYEATWEDHIPLVGRFTPTIEVTGSDGKVTKQELPAIWVIPSWLYLLALVIALALPIWLRVRSRRRYRDLVGRLEAAEGRAAADDHGDEWDDDSLH